MYFFVMIKKKSALYIHNYKCLLTKELATPCGQFKFIVIFCHIRPQITNFHVFYLLFVFPQDKLPI